MGRKWFLLFVLFMGLTAFGGGTAQAQGSAPRITKDELKARLGSSDLVVIDVRGAHGGAGKEPVISGAVREDPSSPDQWAGKYSKKKTLVIYCA